MSYRGDFLSEEALRALDFAALGHNVLVHNTAVLVDCSNISIGDNVRIDPFCVLSVSGGLTIGRNVHIGSNVVLTGSASVSIGDFAGLSHGTRLFSANDDYSGAAMTGPTVPMVYRQVHAAAVCVGKHAIVGSNSVILPGSMIRDGAAVGALCLVRGDLAEWTIYAGSPLRPIRARARTLQYLEEQYLST